MINKFRLPLPLGTFKAFHLFGFFGFFFMCTQKYTLLESFATKFFDTFQVPIDCFKRKFLKNL